MAKDDRRFHPSSIVLGICLGMVLSAVVGLLSSAVGFALWPNLSEEMKAAIVGATATAAAAILGVIAVIRQIGAQAQLALSQSKRNEILKLKLDLYREVLAACKTAYEGTLEIWSCLQRFGADLMLLRDVRQRGAQVAVTPPIRGKELNELFHQTQRKLSNISQTIERWQIIEPRINVFKMAISVGAFDLRSACQKYFEFAHSYMPMDLPSSGTHWRHPSDQDIDQIERLAGKILDAHIQLAMFLYDCEFEMQNLFVGELFEHRVPTRRPADPRVKVIRLDQHDELVAYFENETAWGREKGELKALQKESLEKRAPQARQ